nr:hypothetical protein [Tanacetum cinerariifolium]
MDTTIDQQVAMDEALVPHTRRLRIGRSNFCLLSNISSKESTLQLVYDVLRLTPFFKAFLVIADVSEIYMQGFWATTTVHHHSIRLPGQSFVEPPFEEEIMAFLRFLRHSGAIRRLTDVNINKLHQPWRSFAAIINNCLTGKSSGYDSLRLSQAQILWGLYHKRNVDSAYLMWEDFVYQVEHKDTKKSNEMYYHRFTKVIIYHLMSKDPSIPKRNKVNWHYVRDDHMFTMIKLVSRHQNMQQFSAMLPIELTNTDIRNSDAYKEYYAVTTGATPPKTKASVRKTMSSSDTTVTPPTAATGPRLSTSSKGKQPATTSKAKSLTSLSEVAMTEAQQLKLATKRSLQQTQISQASGSGVDEGTSIIPGVLDVPTKESDEEISWRSSDEGDDDDEEEGDDDDDQEDEGNDADDQEEGGDDDQASDKEEFIHPSLSIHDEEETRDEESFDPIPKTLENTNDEGNGKENLGINVGREEGQDEEDEEDKLYRDVNINLGRGQRTIQVQVSKILPKIEQTVNEQIEAEVLTRSSKSSRTYYVVATDLSEMELKKILIKKMEGNKSIHQSNEQRNLYKAFFEAYESDKIILDTYRDIVTLKRCCEDDVDKDKEPYAGSDRGSKRRREGNEPKSASAPKEKATRSAGKSTQRSKSRQTSASESATAEEPMQTIHEMEEPSHPEFETCRRVIPFDHFINNDLKYLRGVASSHKYTTSVSKTKAADYGHIKWIEDLVPRTMWIQEPIGYDKHALWGISHWGGKGQQFYGFAVNRESARDVYSKCRIIVVIDVTPPKWDAAEYEVRGVLLQ